jgi:hypothetical protein
MLHRQLGVLIDIELPVQSIFHEFTVCVTLKLTLFRTVHFLFLYHICC